MSPVRFQIGVPRAGSAARSSEEAYTSPENDGWTRAKKVALSGSAARAAEEQKRAEGLQPQRSNTVALRATGGAVVDRETMLRHSNAPRSVPLQDSFSGENSEKSANTPSIERITPLRIVSGEDVTVNATVSVPEHDTQDTSSAKGLLQSAASRIQSLTRTLFHHKDASS